MKNWILSLLACALVIHLSYSIGYDIGYNAADREATKVFQSLTTSMSYSEAASRAAGLSRILFEMRQGDTARATKKLEAFIDMALKQADDYDHEFPPFFLPYTSVDWQLLKEDRIRYPRTPPPHIDQTAVTRALDRLIERQTNSMEMKP